MSLVVNWQQYSPAWWPAIGIAHGTSSRAAGCAADSEKHRVDASSNDTIEKDTPGSVPECVFSLGVRVVSVARCRQWCNSLTGASTG